MSGAEIKCPLPFPAWEYNCNIKVYKKEETEADGPKLTLIYDGKAVEKRAQKRQMKTSSQPGENVVENVMYVVHGDINTGNPFAGVVEIDGVRKNISSVAKMKAMGKVYTTEIEVDG